MRERSERGAVAVEAAFASLGLVALLAVLVSGLGAVLLQVQCTDAAAAIGVEVGQIVKSLIFGVDGKIVLAYVSGANQLAEKKLAVAAGGTKCARVAADAVREATGFAIGGVSPIGHLVPPILLFDRDLLALDPIWAAAGSPAHVFRTDPATLARITGATVADIREG